MSRWSEHDRLSDLHRQLWHATKQTRKPEDIASSSEDLARANAKRAKAIKKAANRDRAGPAIVAFIILFVTGVQQFLEIKSMMNAKDGEETVSNYYLNLDINDLSWADILYGTALFCPSIAVVNRVGSPSTACLDSQCLLIFSGT